MVDALVHDEPGQQFAGGRKEHGGIPGFFQIVVNVCVIDGLDGVRVGGLAGQQDFACPGKTVVLGDASKQFYS